jgi:hypothetical protein
VSRQICRWEFPKPRRLSTDENCCNATRLPHGNHLACQGHMAGRNYCTLRSALHGIVNHTPLLCVTLFAFSHIHSCFPSCLCVLAARDTRRPHIPRALAEEGKTACSRHAERRKKRHYTLRSPVSFPAFPTISRSYSSFLHVFY